MNGQPDLRAPTLIINHDDRMFGPSRPVLEAWLHERLIAAFGGWRLPDYAAQCYAENARQTAKHQRRRRNRLRRKRAARRRSRG